MVLSHIPGYPNAQQQLRVRLLVDGLKKLWMAYEHDSSQIAEEQEKSISKCPKAKEIKAAKANQSRSRSGQQTSLEEAILEGTSD